MERGLASVPGVWELATLDRREQTPEQLSVVSEKIIRSDSEPSSEIVIESYSASVFSISSSLNKTVQKYQNLVKVAVTQIMVLVRFYTIT